MTTNNYDNDYDKYQTKIEHRFDLIPQGELREIARVLGEGAKRYGERNWENIPWDSHLNHALNHTNQFLCCEYDDLKNIEDHLIHAICRLMFAHYKFTGGKYVSSYSDNSK